MFMSSLDKEGAPLLRDVHRDVFYDDRRHRQTPVTIKQFNDFYSLDLKQCKSVEEKKG